MKNGIKVEGTFYNEGDTKLTWGEFIAKIESIGLTYEGLSEPIKDGGLVVSTYEDFGYTPKPKRVFDL